MRRLALPLLTASLAACGAGRVPPLVPISAAAAPPEQVRAWVRPDALPGRTLVRFRWSYKNEKGSAGGRGTARIASADTVRLDTAGPLGSGAASAMVVGDSTYWVQPADAIERLVPNFPLMWAMFGLARLPAADAVVEGVSDSAATAWRYRMGSDTLEYRRTPTLLQSVFRSKGKVIGTAETSFGPDGALLKARLVVPQAPARLDLTFTRVTRNAQFEPDVWTPRAPDSAAVDR